MPHLGQENGPQPVGDDAEVVLSVDDLVVEFAGRLGQPSFSAVDHVSLEVRKGEVLGLVGESGSGKTTVGRAAVGLQQPTSGSITVSGTTISGLSEAKLRPHRARFGFVFQDPASSLNPRMSIGDCIGEPLHVQTKLTRPRDRRQGARAAGQRRARRPATPGASRTSSPAVSASASASPARSRSTPTC